MRAQHSPHEGFWWHLGSILGAFREDLGGPGEHFGRILAPLGSSWKKLGQRDIFAKISSTIKMNFHNTWIWSGVFNELRPCITKKHFWWLLCNPISLQFDKTLRIRSKIQGRLSRICEELQPSLTTALKIFRRATTQFLNRSPALIREASQCAGVPPRAWWDNPLKIVNWDVVDFK